MYVLNVQTWISLILASVRSMLVRWHAWWGIFSFLFAYFHISMCKYDFIADSYSFAYTIYWTLNAIRFIKLLIMRIYYSKF